jgi:hypothetical protein
MFGIKENLETLTLHFTTPCGKTDGIAESEKPVMARLFSPSMGWTWIIYEAEFQGDDMLFFGRVDGFASELGYFTWSELEQVPDLEIHTETYSVREMNM